MGKISEEEIRGYNLEGKIVCLDCIEGVEKAEIKEFDILTADVVENEDYHFCDRCHEQL